MEKENPASNNPRNNRTKWHLFEIIGAFFHRYTIHCSLIFRT